jgi:nucleotide-binding universal stress UspA family protein
MISIKKIVCAIDLSAQSAFVAEYALTMTKAFNAEVAVIYVAPQFEQYMGLEAMPTSISQLAADIQAASTASLKKFFEGAFTGVNAKMEVLRGYPADAIVDYAKENGADLIVMGTHGHRGINRILFGSVAEGVVKNSPIPVLTIHPQKED